MIYDKNTINIVHIVDLYFFLFFDKLYALTCYIENKTV